MSTKGTMIGVVTPGRGEQYKPGTTASKALHGDVPTGGNQSVKAKAGNPPKGQWTTDGGSQAVKPG